MLKELLIGLINNLPQEKIANLLDNENYTFEDGILIDIEQDEVTDFLEDYLNVCGLDPDMAISTLNAR